MNDNELIEKLKQLKKLEPSQKTLAVLESRIKAGQAMPAPSLKEKLGTLVRRLQTRPVLAAGALAVCLLVVATVTERNLVLPQAQLLWDRTEIALAPNRFEKAKLALELSQKQLYALQSTKNQNLALQLTYLSQAASQTDGYVRALNLKGEPGKYTMAQCLAVYRTYGNYLDTLKGTIQNRLSSVSDQRTQAQLQSLLSKTSQYEQGVDSKLRQYPD